MSSYLQTINNIAVTLNPYDVTAGGAGQPVKMTFSTPAQDSFVSEVHFTVEGQTHPGGTYTAHATDGSVLATIRSSTSASIDALTGQKLQFNGSRTERINFVPLSVVSTLSNAAQQNLESWYTGQVRIVGGAIGYISLIPASYTTQSSSITNVTVINRGTGRPVTSQQTTTTTITDNDTIFYRNLSVFPVAIIPPPAPNPIIGLLQSASQVSSSAPTNSGSQTGTGVQLIGTGVQLISTFNDPANTFRATSMDQCIMISAPEISEYDYFVGESNGTQAEAVTLTNITTNTPLAISISTPAYIQVLPSPNITLQPQQTLSITLELNGSGADSLVASKIRSFSDIVDFNVNFVSLPTTPVYVLSS